MKTQLIRQQQQTFAKTNNRSSCDLELATEEATAGIDDETKKTRLEKRGGGGS